MADETQILDPVGLNDQVRDSAALFPASPTSQPNHVAHRFLGASRIEPRNGLAPCCRSVINGGAPAVNATTLHSELFYHRNMTVNQNSIALSSDRGSLEIAGVSLLYEGTRVKSYLLGRDLNPMGRGNGAYYPQGAFSEVFLRPKSTAAYLPGLGNSINNMTPVGDGDWKSPCDLPVDPSTGKASCQPGYTGSPQTCCCVDIEDKLEKCVSACSCCCIWNEVDAFCCVKLPKPPNGQSLREALRDRAFAQAHCAAREHNYACALKYVDPDPQHPISCYPEVSWGCCYDFCHGGMSGGDGGGVGGSGGGRFGGSGGGCGGCGGGNKGNSKLSKGLWHVNISSAYDISCKGFTQLIDSEFRSVCGLLRNCNFPDPVMKCLKDVCTGNHTVWFHCKYPCHGKYGSSTPGQFCSDANKPGSLTLCIIDILSTPLKSIKAVILHELIHMCDCRKGADVNRNAVSEAYGCKGNPSDATDAFEYWTEKCTVDCLSSYGISYISDYHRNMPLCCKCTL